MQTFWRLLKQLLVGELMAETLIVPAKRRGRLQGPACDSCSNAERGTPTASALPKAATDPAQYFDIS